MNEALKGVWGEGRGLTEILPNLAALAAFTVLALGLGVRSFHAMLARERRG